MALRRAAGKGETEQSRYALGAMILARPPSGGALTVTKPAMPALRAVAGANAILPSDMAGHRFAIP
jgi:hypothetical protein